MSETPVGAQDHSAIHDIMARYAWCLDRGDFARTRNRRPRLLPRHLCTDGQSM